MGGEHIAKDDLNFPYNIFLNAPSDDFFLTDVDAPDVLTDDAMLKLMEERVTKGTHLFDVFAQADPKSTNTQKIGSITTTSECTRSLFVDKHFFVRHQRMEEDFVLRPEWVDMVKEVGLDGCDPVAEDSSKWQCPRVTSVTQSYA